MTAENLEENMDNLESEKIEEIKFNADEITPGLTEQKEVAEEKPETIEEPAEIPAEIKADFEEPKADNPESEKIEEIKFNADEITPGLTEQKEVAEEKPETIEEPAEIPAEIKAETEENVAKSDSATPEAIESPQQSETITDKDTKEENKSSNSFAKKTAEYIIPSLTVIIVALFFFFLGKKTSNINKEGDFGKENNAIEEYQQPTSSYPAAADEETSEDKDGNTQPSAEDENDVAEQPQNIAIEPEANQENNNGQDVLPDAADKNKESDGSWTKRTYSKDELEYIAEYFKNRLTDAPARAEKVKEYILGKELSELENIMASGMGDPNYVYDQGLTPLNMAVMSNNMDICRLLVAYGADVNKATPNLPAPLILAIGLRNEELIKFFIDSGADVSQKYEIEGKTVIPLNAAEGMGLKQTAELIKQKLAQKK